MYKPESISDIEVAINEFKKNPQYHTYTEMVCYLEEVVDFITQYESVKVSELEFQLNITKDEILELQWKIEDLQVQLDELTDDGG